MCSCFNICHVEIFYQHFQVIFNLPWAAIIYKMLMLSFRSLACLTKIIAEGIRIEFDKLCIGGGKNGEIFDYILFNFRELTILRQPGH